MNDLVGVAPTEHQAQKVHTDDLTTATMLGLQLAPSKCVPLTKTLEWLSFSISAKRMKVSVAGLPREGDYHMVTAGPAQTLVVLIHARGRQG